MQALQEEQQIESMESVQLEVIVEQTGQATDSVFNDRARPSKQLGQGPFSKLTTRTYVMATAILIFCLTAQWYWEEVADDLQHEVTRCASESSESDACKDPDPAKARQGAFTVLAGIQFLIPGLIASIIAATKNGDYLTGLVSLITNGIGSILMIVGYAVYVSGLSPRKIGLNYKHGGEIGEFVIICTTAVCMALDNFKVNLLDDPRKRALLMNAVFFAIFGFGIAMCYAVAGAEVHNNQQYAGHSWTNDRPKPEFETIATGWFIVSIVSGIRVLVIWSCCSRCFNVLLSVLLGIGGIFVTAGYWMTCAWYPSIAAAEKLNAGGMAIFMLTMILANAIDLLYASNVVKEFVSVV